MPQLKFTEVILIHYNIANSQYRHDSRVLHTFVPDKSFGQLLNISQTNHIYLKAFHSEFSCI